MIRLSILWLLLFSDIATAETVFVRSGEHPEYTRLALDIKEGTSWDVESTTSGYRIELGEPVSQFDIDQVFSRIPRQRLVDLIQNGSALEFFVNCTCYLDAYLFSPTMIVLDIRDGPEISNPTLEVPSNESTSPPFWQNPQPNLLSTNLNELGTARRLELPLFIQNAVRLNMIPELALKTPEEYLRVPSRIVAERAIWEQFSSVATQNFVELPPQYLPPTMMADQRIPVLPMSLATVPGEGLTDRLNEVTPSGPGFLLHSAVDRAQDNGEDEAACSTSLSLNISDWGEPASYAALIATQRLAVTDEIGNVRTDAIRSLARTYFYFGFGQEARLSLELLPSLEPQDSLLVMLSRLTDGEAVLLADLQRYRPCSPEMEMWLVLAGQAIDPGNELTISATLNAYRALPETLRGHLGIQLARKFSNANQLNISEDILRDSLSAITGDERAAEIVQSELQGHRNGSEAEATQLGEFIETSSRAEPEDLARLMDLARETQLELETGVFELSEVMRYEANGSEAHATLVEAEVRLLIDRGLAFQALDLLTSEAEAIDQSVQAMLWSSAVTRLAQTASNDDFMSFAFTDLPSDIDNVAINSVITRLIDMGFQDEAMSLVNSTTDGYSENERDAILQLVDTFSSIPGRSEQGSESDSENLSLITDQVGEEGDAVLAWRNGDWEMLESSNDELLSRASRAISSPIGQLGQQTPLADTLSLLEDAGSTRVLVDDLLNRFQIQDIETSN